MMTYFHVRRIEVDFTKFENEKIRPVVGHGDVVAEGGRVVALRLVQDLILLRHTRDHQLLAVVRCRADSVRVSGISDSKDVNVCFASAVDSVNYFLS